MYRVQRRAHMRRVFQFIFAIIVSFIPGAIGNIYSPNGPSDAWYNMLNKSIVTPDGWVFGVAWTTLYALLGIALFLVMRNEQTRLSKTRAYLLFLIQMVLNALWSYTFFGAHMTGWALVVLIALIVASVMMMRAFRPFSKWASYLIWPYILWISFAAYLNIAIVWLN